MALYLSRSNRNLLRAQAEKTGAEGEGTSVEAAVSLIKEMREERRELRERLEEAENREAKTREEREALWKEKHDLQREIELRDGQIRYLRRVLKDAGVVEPQEPQMAVKKAEAK